MLIIVVAGDSTSAESCPWDSSTPLRAPELEAAALASRTKARNFRRVDIAPLTIVAVLRMREGRKPCRCFRAPPCPRVPSLLVADCVGSEGAGLTRAAAGTVAEEPCSLVTAARTSAWAVGSTFLVVVVADRAGSTLQTVEMAGRSWHSLGYQRVACWPGSTDVRRRSVAVVGRSGLEDDVCKQVAPAHEWGADSGTAAARPREFVLVAMPQEIQCQ